MYYFVFHTTLVRFTADDTVEKREREKREREREARERERSKRERSKRERSERERSKRERSKREREERGMRYSPLIIPKFFQFSSPHQFCDQHLVQYPCMASSSRVIFIQ
jgi:ATP-dependent 26S proteasome regulatory subunit